MRNSVALLLFGNMRTIRWQFILFYKAGDRCPQCNQGNLHPTGNINHGDRELSCVKCGWKVRENT